MKDVLTDIGYQKEISKYNNWGMPWIIRWTLSGGKKGDFFKGAPVNPNYLKAVIKLKTIEMFL